MRVEHTGLPVEDAVGALVEALDGVGAAVLQAEPGAGKSTVVPLRLHERARATGGAGDPPRIVMLQPRRVATRAVAARMSALAGTPLGGLVGYRTRDDRAVGPTTRIEVVTEGVLTRRIQRDPTLDGVGLVVFDEIHERSIHADLALALTLDVRRELRPDLEVLAMSATPDGDRIAALLGSATAPAPTIVSTARRHPVEIRWHPLERTATRASRDAAVARTVDTALREQPGDVLVFLDGAGSIRRLERRLAERRTDGGSVEVRPLFGALSAAEQDAALAPSAAGTRRVVLATDIAETSLTVPGVRAVVDAGLVRRPRYEPRRGLTQLTTVAASQASADQRAGRAGRTAPGVAHRLWSAAEHATRPRHDPPEITAVDLTDLTLELAVWGADPASLAFLDPPPGPALDAARDLLVALGALDAAGRPTPLGRRLCGLGLHPRLGRILVDAADRGAARHGAALAALLEERDVVVRGAGRGASATIGCDLDERLAMVLAEAADPRADRAALATVRRRARRLGSRIRDDHRNADGTTGRRPEADTATLLAIGFPDRVAQARGGGRFRLATGRGVVVGAGDPLAAAQHLVVARSVPDPAGGDDDAVALAAPLSTEDVAHLVEQATEHRELRWDAERDDLRLRTERRFGALVLASHDTRPPPGPETTAALLAHVAEVGLVALAPGPAARALQARARFAAAHAPGQWPDLSDAALVASLEQWLAPLLDGATGRRDLEAIRVERVLRSLLGHLGPRLEHDAPAALTLPGGRRVPISYDPDGPGPSIAARAQDLYGIDVHPTVGPARTPVLVTVLSPADRPVQVTADLPGFWAGSWAEVRKDMAGRYPKHRWPQDPSAG